MSQTDDLPAARVLEALYALAAQPDTWAELIAVLDMGGEDTEASEAVRLATGLARGAERIAARAQAAQTASAVPPTPAEIGILILSRSGRVLSENARGQSLRHRLGFTPTVDGPVLTHEANLDVINDIRRAGGDLETVPILARLWLSDDPDVAFVYLLAASALSTDLQVDLSPWDNEKGALAILVPSDADNHAFWNSVKAGFNLTPAELKLAGLLKDGLTLKEAAAEQGLSVNTLRNQLNAIFGKLGVHRQSELIRSLTRLAGLHPHLPIALQQADTQSIVLAQLPELRFLVLPDGRRLAYRQYGPQDGRPVVFCHGGLGASLLPLGAESLCHRLRLRALCPERAGIGRSDPRLGGGFAGAAEDMAAFFDQLDLPPLQLCAFTSGARYALAAAALLGHRVTGVLLLSPRLPPGPGGDDKSPMVRFQQTISRSLWVTESLLSIMRLRLTRPIMDQLVRASATSPGDTAYLDDHPEVIDTFLLALKETWNKSSAAAAAEIRSLRTEGPPDFQAITARVEIWHGKEDTYAKAEVVGAYYQVAPHALRIVPGIGNYLIQKHWTEILTALASVNNPAWSVSADNSRSALF